MCMRYSTNCAEQSRGEALRSELLAHESLPCRSDPYLMRRLDALAEL